MASRGVALLSALLLAVPWAHAAPETLAELTPGDAGACLVVDGIGPEVDRFLAGPHRKRWREFPPVARWLEKHWPSVELLVSQASRQLDIDPQAVWRDVIGGRIMMAVWPPEASGGPSPGLLIVQSTEETTLARLVEGICEAQARSGELIESDARSHAGIDFQARTLRRGEIESEVFLALAGRVAVVASHEHLIKQVLERLANQSDIATSLAASPVYQAALADADPQAPLFAYVNSRCWDGSLATAPSPERKQADQRVLLEIWQATRCWSFTASCAGTPAIEARVHLAPPPAGGRVARAVELLSSPADSLDWIPSDCLAAIGGAVDMAWLLEGANQATIPPGIGQQAADVAPPDRVQNDLASWLGVDPTWRVVAELFDRAFHGVGPGMFGYVAVADPQKRAFPLEIVVGMQTSRQELASADPLSLLRSHETLRTFLLTSVSMANLQPDASRHSLEAIDAETPLLAIEGMKGLPTGWRPTFAAVRGRVLAGTSTEGVLAAANLAPAKALSRRLTVMRMLGERWRKPGQLLYLDMAELGTWLTRHREELLLKLGQGKPDKEWTRRQQRGIEQVRTLLNVADEFVLAVDAKRTSLSLRAVVNIEAAGSP